MSRTRSLSGRTRRLFLTPSTLATAMLATYSTSCSTFPLFSDLRISGFTLRSVSRRVLLSRSLSVSDTDDYLIDLTGEKWADVLPMQKGSHNSARIVVPPTGIDDVSTENIDPFDPSSFRDRLEASITACRELGMTSLWVEVPMSRARLIEDMGAFGLQYHHAVEGKERYV